MKNKKIIQNLALALTIATAGGILSPSLVKAKTLDNLSTTTQTEASKQEKLKQEVLEVAKKYNIQLDFDYKGNTNSNFTVNSAADFENFIKKSKEQIKKEQVNNEINLNVTDQKSLLSSSIVAQAATNYTCHNYDLCWWAPYSAYTTASLFCWKHVIFDYTYKFVNGHPQFVSVQNIRSDVTGLQAGVTWTPSYGSYWRQTKNYYCDTAHVTATGKWFFGISIGGVTAGASWYDTWDCSLTLT